MNKIEASDFQDFFKALYTYSPMNWQCDLAAAACRGDWPDFICVPTGAGKTSAIDVAVFALAVQAKLPPDQRTAAMRTFLVVDRRTVVSEAFFRASCLRERLETATGGILKSVADQLRSYSGEKHSGPPLRVVEMRGGIYRDRSWCNSLTQPMIITSTVDQVGSRSLFRGYGVSNLARPIQAAVVSHDSLIILDEAHISTAFSETLGYVRNYQKAPWCEVPLPRQLRVVEMTATPSETSTAKRIEIKQSELDDPTTHIGRIVNTAKPTSLVIATNVKGSKAPNQLAAVLVEHALDKIVLDPKQEQLNEVNDNDKKSKRKVVGIMCNMVATAKAAVALLSKNKSIAEDQIYMVIGAMRPLDRDVQTNVLRQLISTGADRESINRPLFVVSTQCIEVGADYDFDVLITEAAPLDSLVQRFGRLNRAGRDFPAVGCVVMRGDWIKTNEQLINDETAFKYADPIYGNSTSHTWNWLDVVAKDGHLNFGIAAFKKLTQKINNEDRERMSTNSVSAPVLLPAHLDMLCQTSIDPWPDPDVSLWLHGPRRNDPEVQICWRADLLPPAVPSNEFPDCVNVSLVSLRNENRHSELIHAISLCPPTSTECLSVPLRRVVSWLTSVAKHRKIEADLSGDIPQIVEESDSDEQLIPFPFRPIVWRGIEKSKVVGNTNEIRPGDTLVLTPIAGGWNELGYLPKFHDWDCHDEKGNLLSNKLLTIAAANGASVNCKTEDFAKISTIDVAREAFAKNRNRPIVRLHPNLVAISSWRPLYDELLSQGEEFYWKKSQFLDLLEALPTEYTDGFSGVNAKSLKVEFYANRTGVVIIGPIMKQDVDIELASDDGGDSLCQIAGGEPVELSSHLERVRLETNRFVSTLALADFRKTLGRAAEVHDWGKADPRFQAMLLGGDLYSALWENKLYAKSANMPMSAKEKDAAASLSKIPAKFRHEMLSLAFAESFSDQFDKVEDFELLLHLIASHHGHARPWVPVCIDKDPPEISLDRIQLPDLSLTANERMKVAYHRIDSSVPQRFWVVTRRYGWWGTAFLESVLRIADHRVSQVEGTVQGEPSNKTNGTLAETFV